MTGIRNQGSGQQVCLMKEITIGNGIEDGAGDRSHVWEAGQQSATPSGRP
jgi:hypothetical protein